MHEAGEILDAGAARTLARHGDEARIDLVADRACTELERRRHHDAPIARAEIDESVLRRHASQSQQRSRDLGHRRLEAHVRTLGLRRLLPFTLGSARRVALIHRRKFVRWSAHTRGVPVALSWRTTANSSTRSGAPRLSLAAAAAITR